MRRNLPQPAALSTRMDNGMNALRRKLVHPVGLGTLPYAALALMLTSAFAMAAQGSASTAFIVDRVYTSPDEQPIERGVILVQQDKIVAVGTRTSLSIPEGAKIVEMKGASALAGFWNSHVHFIEKVFENAATAPVDALTAHLQGMLTKHGVVYAYQVAALDIPNTVALRERIRRGEVIGPEIYTTGLPLVAEDGTPGYIHGLKFPEVTDASAARKEVERQLAAGADGIKLMTVTGNERGLHPMLLEAAQAAVSVAHAEDRLVFAHPTNVQGVKIAMHAGVDVIVHTSPDRLEEWDEPLVAEMKRRKVTLIPTLKLYQWDPLRQGASQEMTQRVLNAALQQLSLFAKSGGTLLFGTDVGYMTDYDPMEEYLLMQKAGLSFEQILASLTTTPAKLFDTSKRTGAIKAGMDASLVFVEGDPKKDLTALGRIVRVVSKGKTQYEGTRDSP
jgi:imidazolonepropionase-like amidohydrolase